MASRSRRDPGPTIPPRVPRGEGSVPCGEGSGMGTAGAFGGEGVCGSVLGADSGGLVQPHADRAVHLAVPPRSGADILRHYRRATEGRRLGLTAVVVTAACIQDRGGARLLVREARSRGPVLCARSRTGQAPRRGAHGYTAT